MKLRYRLRKLAADFLMREERKSIDDDCLYSKSEVIDSENRVRLEVVAWNTSHIDRMPSDRTPGFCYCGVLLDPLHRDGGRCVHCGRDIEPGWFGEETLQR
jgi:hypothetical protein